MGVYKAPRLRQADAVDNAGMVERVTDYGVFGTENSFKQTAVGVKTGRIQNGIFRTMKIADLFLQAGMKILGTTYKAYGGQAESIMVQGVLGRLDHAGMIGKSQVVVGAEIEHVPRLNSGWVLNPDPGLLIGKNNSLFFE